MNSGLVIARALNMTPARFNEALGKSYRRDDPESRRPADWLGFMLLKVLKEKEPRTGGDRPYTDREIEFLWEEAQRLPVNLKPDLSALLRSRQANVKLWEAVRNWAGRRPVFTLTGRLRANTTFCSSRNCVFQGAAADGAILALWLVWRAGYKLVDFVHDQLVVESPADGRVHERVLEIEALMKEGMRSVVPGMLVKVETVVTRSLNKQDLHPDYKDPPARKEVCGETAQPAA